MIYRHAVPILYSEDVVRSLQYYTEVLGFDSKWQWDTTATFGGVRKDAVEIFFCKQGQGNPGTWLSVMISEVDELYENAKARGAKILSEPKTMEWGIREMLVEDPDGHIIRFGQPAPPADRDEHSGAMPDTVRLIERIPTAKEMHRLTVSVGWSSPGDEPPSEIPASPIAYCVVAEDTATNEIIGCAFLLSDQAGFYYVKNVIVHTDWQGKHIGTAMMQKLSDWMEKNITDAFVTLHTPERLAPFYKQFGFLPIFSMFRAVHPKKKQ